MLSPIKCRLTKTINLQRYFIFLRRRHYFRNMDCTNLLPPKHVRLMTCLDRDQFRKTVTIPTLDLTNIQINKVLPHLKHILLKMVRLKALQPTKSGGKKVLLHPLGVNSWDDIPEIVHSFGITGDHFTMEDFDLTYENWRADEILKAVLPDDQETSSSFSIIGHIVHLNLREHLLPYKKLIGEVLMDKVSQCRTVVNKCETIDNTFRNFQMEVLCGEPDFKVNVKANGVQFEFDFSTVYWNPRLNIEHERIIKLLRSGDVLYDVFAGVGPFSVPAGKKGCTVLANDLNPDSFKWLQTNINRNKVNRRVSAFNKDGIDFIREEIKNDLMIRWHNTDDRNEYKIHITMHLPAMAVEFLHAFRGLLNQIDEMSHPIYPLVHVYCFAKGANTADIARTLVEDNLGVKLTDNLDGIYFVRNVAPNKDMYRITFYLTKEILCASRSQKRPKESSPDVDQSDSKKVCVS